MTKIMGLRFFYEYRGSQLVAAEISRLTYGNEFYTLLMAAMRFADTNNLSKLESAFPDVVKELRMRYQAPGGALTPEEMELAERGRS